MIHPTAEVSEHANYAIITQPLASPAIWHWGIAPL